MLPPSLLNRFPLGAINIHPSLLPKYRGPAPIQNALIHGDTQTGVCIIEVDPKAFDSGNILKKQIVDIPRDWTYTNLSTHLANVGGDLLLQVLEDLPTHRANARKQNGTVSKAPKPKLEWKIVTDWRNAERVWNLYRAFEQIKSDFKKAPNEVQVTLLEVAPPASLASLVGFAVPYVKGKTLFQVGDAFLNPSRKAVAIKVGNDDDDVWLSCEKFCVDNKKPVTAAQFFDGHLLRHATSDFDLGTKKTVLVKGAFEGVIKALVFGLCDCTRRK